MTTTSKEHPATPPDLPPPAGKPPQAKRSVGQKFRRSFLIFFGAIFAVFFLYRWLGTVNHQGTVQRVYETGDIYHVEFVDTEGEIHVIKNDDIRFPYFKLDTADLHAELNRYAKRGDVIELKAWGFRFSWFSIFPNAISATLIEAASENHREQAQAISKRVLALLKNKGALVEGVEVQDAVAEAVEDSLKDPIKSSVSKEK